LKGKISDDKNTFCVPRQDSVAGVL